MRVSLDNICIKDFDRKVVRSGPRDTYVWIRFEDNCHNDFVLCYLCRMSTQLGSYLLTTLANAGHGIIYSSKMPHWQLSCQQQVSIMAATNKAHSSNFSPKRCVPLLIVLLPQRGRKSCGTNYLGMPRSLALLLWPNPPQCTSVGSTTFDASRFCPSNAFSSNDSLWWVRYRKMILGTTQIIVLTLLSWYRIS